ncbi:MAG: DUF447 family protein [Methanospirillum sp.]|uniref:DUF447 domain-containing protein n=1 Tax=Methanospirillum sp. TaxID=45200 RepID=UPI002368FC0D|nr:DUF447 domain-containing protein [Methanospirillum sp.]MDD1729438.1 DUF447 family protein [Methanospirillum sp.]
MSDSYFWPMQEGINEVIATTRFHAAPMGIICRDERVMMAVFRTSHTAVLIEETGMVVANIIHDPVLFVRTAFSDLESAELTEFEVADTKVCRLSCADSWVVYRSRIEQKTELKLLVRLDPVQIILTQTTMTPINRGLNSIIEASVHGTRYVNTRDPDLKQLIDHHVDLVKRCGGERELLALRLLLEYIG